MSSSATNSQRYPRTFARVIGRGARLLARGIYRSVEVDNPEPGWSHGPAILVANHPTGFSDPALLLGLLEAKPRFLAKATLWNTPGLGRFLDGIGAIPVYRAQDGSTANNTAMFAAAFDALDRGATIALFPEGGANDAAALAPLKTGAARLALGAHAAGVRRIHLVPVGIHYEANAGIRTRAYVQVGDVLDLDTELGDIGIASNADAEDRAAVVALTTEIEERLRSSAPNFSDDLEAERLTFASEVALREPGSFRVSYADRQLVAAALAQVPADHHAAVGASADRYKAELDGAGVSDGDIMLSRRPPGLGSRMLWLAVVLALLAPVVVAGAVLNAVPALALFAMARYRHREMTPATVRLFSAILLFLITWLVWSGVAWALGDWRLGLVTLVACPLYGAVTVGALDRAGDLREMWKGRRRAKGIGGAIDGLLADRHDLVAEVEGALQS